MGTWTHPALARKRSTACRNNAVAETLFIQPFTSSAEQFALQHRSGSLCFATSHAASLARAREAPAFF